MADYCIIYVVQSLLFNSIDVIRRNTITFYKKKIVTYTILVFFSVKICKKSFKIPKK